jgi:hypothetical protein
MCAVVQTGLLCGFNNDKVWSHGKKYFAITQPSRPRIAIFVNFMALLRFFLTIIIVLPFVFSKNETIPDIMNNFLASFPDIQLQALVQKVNQSMPIIENLLDHSNLMVDLANVTVEKNGR